MFVPVRYKSPAPVLVRATVPEPSSMTPENVLLSDSALSTVNVAVPVTPEVTVPLPPSLPTVGL